MADDLRRIREEQGITLEQVYERTRIPVKWLDALERGDTAAFPPGPFLTGYTRQYRTFLGLSPVAAPSPSGPSRPLELPDPPVRPRAAKPAEASGEASAPVPPPRRPREPDVAPDPVGQVRRTHEESTITLTSPRARIARVGRMGAAGLVLAGLLLGGLWFAQRVTPDEADGGLDQPPDQVLLITSASGVHARVEADGRELYNEALPPGRQMKFAAQDRLSVELEALDGVSLVYNGRTLKPLGAQSRARRLVFLDDHGS